MWGIERLRDRVTRMTRKFLGREEEVLFSEAMEFVWEFEFRLSGIIGDENGPLKIM